MSANVRSTDQLDPSGQPLIPIKREMPLPFVLTGLATIIAGLFGMYYQGQRTAEKTADIAVDVKQIKDDLQRQGFKAAEEGYTVRDLSRRVTVIEAIVQAQQPGKGR